MGGAYRRGFGGTVDFRCAGGELWVSGGVSAGLGVQGRSWGCRAGFQGCRAEFGGVGLGFGGAVEVWSAGLDLGVQGGGIKMGF